MRLLVEYNIDASGGKCTGCSRLTGETCALFQEPVRNQLRCIRCINAETAANPPKTKTKVLPRPDMPEAKKDKPGVAEKEADLALVDGVIELADRVADINNDDAQEFATSVQEKAVSMKASIHEWGKLTTGQRAALENMGSGCSKWLDRH
jgi:hypothetical protein